MKILKNENDEWEFIPERPSDIIFLEEYKDKSIIIRSEE